MAHYRIYLPPARTIGFLLLVYSHIGVALDWPNYRGPNRDGTSAETEWTTDWPKDGPKQLWRASVGTGFSSISVVGNRVYTMGHSDGEDTVYCLDAENGKNVWEFSYPSSLWDIQHEGGPSSTPTVADGRVYTLSREALLHCLNAASGEELWSKDLKKEVCADVPRWGFSGSVLIDRDLAIVDVGPAVALEKDTGTIVWKTKEYGAAYSTPGRLSLENKDFLTAFNRTGLVVLRRDGGGEAAVYPWETQWGVNAAIPIIRENRIFLSTNYGKGATVLQFDGEGALTPVWENTNLMNHFNSSVEHEGYVYGYSGHLGRNSEGDLRCLNFNTGELMWTEKSVKKGSVLLCGGKLIALTGRGELVVAEPSPGGFREISRAHVLTGKCWTEPAFSGARLYCRNAGGDLICLDFGG